MKLATIGSGFIVLQFLDACKKVEGVELVASYSRNIGNANELKDNFNMNEAYDDYEAFIHSKSFDTVYIASPNSLHYQQAKDCLNANKNVILEKPFCSTDKESQEIINLAKSKGLYLFEAMSINYMPNIDLLKTKLDYVKPIRWIELSMCQYSRQYDAFKAGKIPNVFNPEFSGGALMDLNVYHLNFILNLFDIPKMIHYYPECADNGIDVAGMMLMHYEGFKVSAIAAKNAKGKPFGIIHGENGIIEFNEGINGLNSFEIEGERFNVQEQENRLYYEVYAFEMLIKNKDFDRMCQRLDTTQTRMEILTKMRLDAKIRFKADH